MILLRLVAALAIFYFPFAGGILSMLLDGVDWKTQIISTPYQHVVYENFDKVLDLYYLSIEAFVMFRWRSIWAKGIGYFLYFLRIVGIGLFFWLNRAALLFFFPNIFESYFLFYVAVKAILGREAKLSPATLLTSVIVLSIPKILQEYQMHFLYKSYWRFWEIPGTSLAYDNLVHQIVIGILLVLIVVIKVKWLKGKFW